MVNIHNYIDAESGIIEFDEYKIFKKNIFLHFNESINTKSQYKCIKVIWNVSVADLKSESIAESLLSFAGQIYTKQRRRMSKDRLEQLLSYRTSLPSSQAQRQNVCHKVQQEYENRYKNHVNHHVSNRTKSQRQSRNGSVKSDVIINAYNRNHTIYQ